MLARAKRKRFFGLCFLIRVCVHARKCFVAFSDRFFFFFTPGLSLSFSLRNMKSLRDLNLFSCGLRTVSAFFGELKVLENLNFWKN